MDVSEIGMLRYYCCYTPYDARCLLRCDHTPLGHLAILPQWPSGNTLRDKCITPKSKHKRISQHDHCKDREMWRLSLLDL